MATRRQRIRNDAYKTIYVATVGSTADRDTKCDDYRDAKRISETQLANSCPQLKKDVFV